MTGIGSRMILDGLSKTQALKKIEGLGFPKPARWSLPLYFRVSENDGTFVDAVNFDTLRQEIEEVDLPSKTKMIVGLPKDDPKRAEVLTLVKKIIDKHLI